MKNRLKNKLPLTDLLYEVKKRIEQETNRQVVHLAIVGSWQHNLANETSDYDIKVFVLPTIEDLLNANMLNTTCKYPDLNTEGEVKDIRLLFELLEKQNPNYLDCLNPYANITDPDFNVLFNQMQFWYQYNPSKCFSGCFGWFNRYKALFMRDIGENHYTKLCKLTSNMLLMLYIADYLTSTGSYPYDFTNESITYCQFVKNKGLGYEDVLLIPDTVEKKFQELKSYWDTQPKNPDKNKIMQKEHFKTIVRNIIWQKVKDTDI